MLRDGVRLLARITQQDYCQDPGNKDVVEIIGSRVVVVIMFFVEK